MDISEIRRINLKAILAEHFGGNQAELARAMDISPNNISRYFSDNAEYGRRISDKAARDIEAAAGLDRGWMDSSINALAESTGRAAGELPASGSIENKDWALVDPGTEGAIPLLSWAFLGNLDDAALEDIAVGWVKSPGGLSDHAYALRVSGDSMVADDDSGYATGDIIFVEPATTAKSRDLVLAVVPGTCDPTFKQYVVFEQIPYLLPLNRRYPTLEMPAGTKVVGVVVGAQRSR